MSLLCCGLLGRRRSRPLVLEARVALPHRPQELIPEGEEGLGEVGLDPPALVVDVVVGGVVARDVLYGIPRKRIAAVVVDRLDGAPHEEPHPQAGGHQGELVGEARARGVQQEAFDGVVVESSERVRDV